MGDEDTVRWHHWERQLEKARREGVIEGLERALACFPKPTSTTQWDAEDAIRAEIERLKRDQD